MLRRLLLVGAVQGLALWGLRRIHELEIIGLWQTLEQRILPTTDLIGERALLYLVLALPLTIYLTEGIPSLTRQRRLLLLGVIAVLSPLLGAYSGWVDDVPISADYLYFDHFIRRSDLLAAAVLGFVLIPLLAHFDPASRGWSYRELFETAWRNAILCIGAALMTGVFWVVLVAAHLSGLDILGKLIERSLFFITVTCIVLAATFALALAHPGKVVALRRSLHSLLRLSLPLLMMFILIWVVALPFTGVELPFNSHITVRSMLWSAVLCIIFINAAYQDGHVAPLYGALLGKLLPWAWLGLFAVVGLAWWAMGLRIAQHGWSENRVWGVFAIVMATLYVTGYAASVLRRDGRMASIGKTNMWAAAVLCLGLLLLLSPIADVRRIVVAGQMQRLTSQAVAVNRFDFDLLRWQTGKYGQDALRTLRSGIAHPDRALIASRAKQVLAQRDEQGTGAIAEGIQALTTDEVRQRLGALPAKTRLSDTFLKSIQSESENYMVLANCFTGERRCAVWMVDLDAAQSPEAVILFKDEGGYWGGGIVMQNIDGRYRVVGDLVFSEDVSTASFNEYVEQIADGRYKLVSPKRASLAPGWREIEVSTPALRWHVELDRYRNK